MYAECDAQVYGSVEAYWLSLGEDNVNKLGITLQQIEIQNVGTADVTFP